MEEILFATVIRKVYSTFFQLADISLMPILYQHLTDILFRKLLDDHCTTSSHSKSLSSAIMQHEGNVIQYAAGYICKKASGKKIESKHHYKEEMVLCFMELVKDKDSTCDNSEEWTVKMNRRGLCHIRSFQRL